MKEIQLTQGKVALVDDEDFEYLNQFKWNAYKKNNVFYTSRYTGKVNGKHIYIYMHWDVMDRKWIDHVDHDGLNNQRSNLRPCTSQQNMMNGRKRNVITSSKFKGVCWFKRKSKWIAFIKKEKQIHLGYFNNEIEAAKAYNTKAIELFGEFACLNEFNNT